MEGRKYKKLTCLQIDIMKFLFDEQIEVKSNLIYIPGIEQMTIEKSINQLLEYKILEEAIDDGSIYNKSKRVKITALGVERLKASAPA